MIFLLEKYILNLLNVSLSYIFESFDKDFRVINTFIVEFMNEQSLISYRCLIFTAKRNKI